MFKHGALPLRKALLAGHALKASNLVLMATPSMPSQIACCPDAGIWTRRILTAKIFNLAAHANLPIELSDTIKR
jgi:hypothetical protein